MSLVDDKNQLDDQANEKKQKKVDDEKAKAEEIRGAACETVKRRGNCKFILELNST
jgi:hypothetical protein